jgi:hypothetical protein
LQMYQGVVYKFDLWPNPIIISLFIQDNSVNCNTIGLELTNFV